MEGNGGGGNGGSLPVSMRWRVMVVGYCRLLTGVHGAEGNGGSLLVSME